MSRLHVIGLVRLYYAECTKGHSGQGECVGLNFDA